jgi:hypothetical protein
MKRLLVILAVLLAGCGGANAVREPPVKVSGAPDVAPTPGAPVPDGAVRIAVVTHGPASSKFWAIIRNGVDAAARRLDVLVDYKSPDVFSVQRMSGRHQARRTGRLDPERRPGAGDPPCGGGRHPGHLDQLRQRRLPRARRARPRRPGREPRRL